MHIRSLYRKIIIKTRTNKTNDFNTAKLIIYYFAKIVKSNSLIT